MTTRFTFSMHDARRLPLAALLGAALLAGCSSVALDDAQAPVETRTPGAIDPNAAGAAGAGATSQSRVAPVDLTQGGRDGVDADRERDRTVYFDFDSYVVKDEYRPLVERYAKSLVADRKRNVRISGHTDERGGREYNLALGQKRSEAVAKSLELLGAAESQVEAVSYGKERPAALGSDEAAWAQNRRAELNYR